MAETTYADRATALSDLDLAAYAYGGADGHTGVCLSERPAGGRVSLRGDPGDRAFMTAVGQALDMVLPTDPNTGAVADRATALWLGPDEWLLTTRADAASAVAEGLRDALAGLAAAVVDVSDAATVIGLSGPRAADVLAKGCALDLHPTVFGPGRVAQTLVAQADVILHRVEGGPAGEPAFDIHVRRSFAEYLWQWLADAAMEYGVGVDR